MPLSEQPNALEATGYPTPCLAYDDGSSRYGSDSESVRDISSSNSPSATDNECSCGAAIEIRALKERIKELEKALADAQEHIKLKDERIKQLIEKLKKKKTQPWSAPPQYEGPMKITFSKIHDKRGNELHQRKLPDYFYRTLHENSATLSCYTTNACWDKTRERASILKKRNAFQSLGDFEFHKHLNKKMAVRHLNWSQKHPSTVYISAFDDWDSASARAVYHYRDSPVVSRRISIAKIKTSGLIPAFFETIHEDTPVKIPIWIRGRVVPRDRSPIAIDSTEDLMKSGTEIWFSIQDNRNHGLSLSPEGHRGHPEEWFALGHILKSSVEVVFPYDGKTIHLIEVSNVVTSAADKDWEYDWESWIWRSKEEMSEIREALIRDENKKRKTPTQDSGISESSKRPKLNSFEYALLQHKSSISGN